jgi:Cd2+/Zn2+-exporting ATPase
MAVDKTGTLTRGQPEVTVVRTLNGASEAEVLRLAAAVEARSEHPLAEAVLRAARIRGLTWPEARDFIAVPGRGATAVVAGKRIHVGNIRYAEDLEIRDSQTRARVADLEEEAQTPVVVSDGQKALGVLGLADRLRAETPDAVRALHALGVRPIVMLTGDVRGTAEAIARHAGVDALQAELLPDRKVAAVTALARQHGAVAMVGDGINDAPALAAASVGIAMGVAGTDAAIETADVALMSDDLRQLPAAVRLGRRTLGIIRANILLSLATKAVFVLLTVLGHATLWMAVLADMGTSLLVIGNGLRLLRESGQPLSQAKAAAPHVPERSGCCAGCERPR